jgi:hypothetical protein
MMTQAWYLTHREAKRSKLIPDPSEATTGVDARPETEELRDRIKEMVRAALRAA